MLNRLRERLGLLSLPQNNPAPVTIAQAKAPFSERHKKLNRGDVPVRFFDSVGFIEIDNPVIIGRIYDQVLDNKTIAEDLQTLENPFNRQPIHLLVPVLNPNFSEEEIQLILAGLKKSSISPDTIAAFHLRYKINHNHLRSHEDFSDEDLLLIEKCCGNLPEHTLYKIDCYIRLKILYQFLKQRDTYIDSLENIERLKNEMAEIAKPIDTAPLKEDLAENEFNALKQQIVYEQEQQLIEKKLELIQELASFIKTTKTLIWAWQSSNDDKVKEIRRVVGNEYYLYKKEIENVTALLTKHKQRVGSFEELYLDDRLKGALIPYHPRRTEMNGTAALARFFCPYIPLQTFNRVERKVIKPQQ